MTSSVNMSDLVTLIKTMTNAQMKEALRSEGLAVSGVKISLQLRLIECEDHPFSLVAFVVSF
jgi:E3 SUMO-protein ligase PIAS1